MEQPYQVYNWFWFCVEIAKALAWPAAVTFSVWWTKPQIAAFFKAIQQQKVEVDAWGFKAKINAVDKQQAAQDNPAVAKTLETLQPSPRPAVNSIEAQLIKQLESIPANLTVATLQRALAETRLRAGHEYTYNRIFGSQILGLRRLDEASVATVDEAEKFFEPFSRQFPDVYRNYGFEGWLGFLISNGLVNRTGDHLRVTEFGHDFLVYLREARLSEDKGF